MYLAGTCSLAVKKLDGAWNGPMRGRHAPVRSRLSPAAPSDAARRRRDLTRMI